MYYANNLIYTRSRGNLWPATDSTFSATSHITWRKTDNVQLQSTINKYLYCCIAESMSLTSLILMPITAKC